MADTATCIMSSASSYPQNGGTAISRASNRVAHHSPSTRLRVPKAEHWRAGLISEKPARSDNRTDSKFEPDTLDLPIEPAGTTAATPDESRFFNLPATLRSTIYEHLLVQEGKVLPNNSTASSQILQSAIALAFPSLSNEIEEHLPYYLRCNTFTFDLRTEHGASAFHVWTTSLGLYAWNVQSLALKHWTAWWGFGENSWTALEDETHFSRDAHGGLVISRSVETPRRETCSCTLADLMAQFDRTFDPARFRALRSVKQFAECLRAGESGTERLALVDAAKVFAALLDEHSRRLSKEFVLAGDDCPRCRMPRLYLCGHLSTRDYGDGTEVTFYGKLRNRSSSVF